MTRSIAINGRFLTRAATGVDRFAHELLREWLPRYRVAATTRFVVSRHAELQNQPPMPLPIDRVGRFSGHAWEQLDLPRECADEMLVNLCNTGPVLQRSQLVVLHDAAVMAYPHTYSFAYRQWHQWMNRRLIARAGLILTVSEFSASEFIRYFGFPAKRFEIVSEGGEHILRLPSRPEVLARLGLAGQDYVLVVGSRTPNKNFGAVLTAVGLLDPKTKVVAVGGANQRVYANVNLTTDYLIAAGFVTDGELRALYENALCFVFPSLYEGFGLPPLEAMHCGCPTLVSRTASLPEICADAAAYCDPHDPRDIAKQLQRLIDSEAMRSELRRAGLERAKLFSWERAARQFQDIISV